MVDINLRPPPEETSATTEEATEQIPADEMRARLSRMQSGADTPTTPPPTAQAEHSLDALHVEDKYRDEGVRIIVRPYADLESSRCASPGADNCRWLALRAEIASSEAPEQKVLAVTQTCRDIKFSVKIPGDEQEADGRPPLWCELYYDPASDKLVLLNLSEVQISLQRIQRHPASPHLSSPLISAPALVDPGLAKTVVPGTWRICFEDITVMDFRILEKKPFYIYAAPPVPKQLTFSETSSPLNSNSKRSHEDAEAEAENSARIKRRLSELDAHRGPNANRVVFMPPSVDPVVFSLPSGPDANGNGDIRPGLQLSNTNSNPLIDLLSNGTAADSISVRGLCELDQYDLTRKDRITANHVSAVYVGDHSRHDIVTVKVLKTRAYNPADRPLAYERDIIRQADMWLRETRTQEGLDHDSIVRYYGGDARFLSMYMEHIDAKDLSIQGRWRARGTDEFTGTRADVTNIVTDIAGALGYLHACGKVHNDIKPANILYSPERGAVLCDFGMSTPTDKPPAGGGTPYYIPPEFIGLQLRGPESDVWALGVTLLYTLRKIPWPESNSRASHPKPKRLYWEIKCVNNPHVRHEHVGNGQPAVAQMRAWIEEVKAARAALNRHDLLERLVWGMLTPDFKKRLTMADVLRELEAHEPQYVAAE